MGGAKPRRRGGINPHLSESKVLSGNVSIAKGCFGMGGGSNNQRRHSHLGQSNVLFEPKFFMDMPTLLACLDMYALFTSITLHHGKRAALAFSDSLNAK